MVSLAQKWSVWVKNLNVNGGNFPYISLAKWDIESVTTTSIVAMNLIRM